MFFCCGIKCKKHGTKVQALQLRYKVAALRFQEKEGVFLGKEHIRWSSAFLAQAVHKSLLDHRNRRKFYKVI
jgi:hypothetical protein